MSTETRTVYPNLDTLYEEGLRLGEVWYVEAHKRDDEKGTGLLAWCVTLCATGHEDSGYGGAEISAEGFGEDLAAACHDAILELRDLR